MPEINGKAVTFRDSLPASVWWNLFPKVASVKPGEKFLEKYAWEDAVALCKAALESWEFEGPPGDAASYEALGLVDMMALVGAAHSHVIGLFNERAGESGEVASGRT